MTIVLPEVLVDGRRLGRHINHDPHSLSYLLAETDQVVSVSWPRHIPILDQGNLGSYTGNAETGALGTGPLFDALPAAVRGQLDEGYAVGIYSDAEKIDGGAGYPPEDQGSSGLSVAKVALNRGLISGYQHATSVAAAHTAIQVGPFLVGSYWTTGMDNPTSEGIVTFTGTKRGGHEYLCREYDAARDLWWMDNSWGLSFGVQGRFAYDTPTFTALLAQYGDVTSLVPLAAPAPTPTPASTIRSFTGADVALLDSWSSGRHWGTNKAAAQAWKRGVPQ